MKEVSDDGRNRGSVRHGRFGRSVEPENEAGAVGSVGVLSTAAAPLGRAGDPWRSFR
jgi:hypothetical protein